MDSRNILSRLSLFGAAMVWGSSFFVVKNTVDVFPPHFMLAIRFTIGALLLGAVFFKRLRKIDWNYIKSGLIIGTCLFSGYSLQTIGITDTTPGKNAFLTAIYCVIVPFLYWIVNKKRPQIKNVAAALLCVGGIGFVSLSSNFTIGFGDVMTIAGGFVYAAHLVFITKFAFDKDPIVITILQFAFAAIISWIFFFASETSPQSVTLTSSAGLLYLAVFPTAVAILLQNIGQKITNPSAAAIILSLESVFGVVFSMIFYGEKLTLKLVFGFALIFAAVIVSEINLTKMRILNK